MPLTFHGFRKTPEAAIKRALKRFVGEKNVPVRQIAEALGFSERTLHRYAKKAGIKSGRVAGRPSIKRREQSFNDDF